LLFFKVETVWYWFNSIIQ